MSAVSRAIKLYPAVVITVVVGVIGLILLATPLREFVPYGIGAYALIIAAWQAVEMVLSLIRGNLGLDVLAVTAITAAVLVGEPWAALVVVLMLTGGEALEDYAENRSKRELTALLNRVPQQATRLLQPAGVAASSASMPARDHFEDQAETIDVDEVAVGDRLLVRPGEVVPVDAVLETETAEFDESSVTGESLPVVRDSGDQIVSGVVNGSTAVVVRAAAVAAESEYQRIVTLVAEAQRSKSRTVRLADRYAIPFTVVSLLIAGLAWYASGDASRFAEVLVVATPCPLLIAAPVAFLGGMSRAAKAGLIVKGGGTLEQLSKVRSVAFDKTGTLTKGQPELRRLRPVGGVSETELLQLAASAEVFSSHVLAAAVVNAAEERGIALHTASGAEEHATNGVEARIAAGTVRVGKPSWVAGFAPELTRAELGPGELAIYVALDDRFVGTIIMQDQLRDEAPGLLAELRDLGITRFAMVTGDVEATAAHVAAELGIDEVHAEATPVDKVRIAESLGPRPLLMVGDGLNDAPVLAAADAGFAMGARGATAASESADIVNRFDRVDSVATVVRIGRDTVRIALESIWAGIIISVGLMLVAAFGYLPALAGAWLQEVVDLVAILGALRAVREPKRARPAVK